MSLFNPASISDRQELLDRLVPLCREAGSAIMAVHARSDRTSSAMKKGDGSPVTEADLKANTILCDGLRAMVPNVPIVSEEEAASHAMAATPPAFFLVDPLDGTKEFLKADGKGAFTVNIGLILNGLPVLGVVFAPALNRLFAGTVGGSAFHMNETGLRQTMKVRTVPKSGAVAVASASHRDSDTDAWLTGAGITETVSIGSSLKFCLVANAEADVYPRFGPTMEWDTAAGHAVLIAAGGDVIQPDGTPFTYGKAEFRNGPFIARGDFDRAAL